jgi:tRNA threonylcarbamoyladenosine biosynthesis protein TsaE
MILEVKSEVEMKALGAKIGALLDAGDILELVGDVGAGKTTLAKGIAAGLGVSEDVQSPSFMISRVYETASRLRLAHYDFYRLNDAGIMAAELHETLSDPETVAIIEWADVASDVLPADILAIRITSPDEYSRKLELIAGGEKSKKLLERLK